MSSKLIIDATEKGGEKVFSFPPRELMMKALVVWKEMGLPEFDVPKRVRYILERCG